MPKPLQTQHKNVRKRCGKHTTKMEPKNEHFRSHRGAKNDPKIDQNGAGVINPGWFFSRPAKNGPRATPGLPKWSQKWPFWEPWGSRNQAKRAPRHLFNHYIRWVLPAHQRASAATHQSHHFDARWLPKWSQNGTPGHLQVLLSMNNLLLSFWHNFFGSPPLLPPFSHLPPLPSSTIMKQNKSYVYI